MKKQTKRQSNVPILKPITSEKAVKLLEIENVLLFEVDKRSTKNQLKSQIEETFKVKVHSIRSLIRKNKKIVYVRLDQKNPAIDVATKLGMI